MSRSQTCPLQPEQIISSFSSRREDKLLFQSQKELVAATHQLIGHLRSAPASRHAGATREGVSVKSRNEISQKKYRVLELWAIRKLYLTEIHIYLHKYKACYLKMPNHSWDMLGYMGSSHRLLGVRAAFTFKKFINLPHEQPLLQRVKGNIRYRNFLKYYQILNLVSANFALI